MKITVDLVVVAYFPEKERFSKCLDSLKNQVQNIIIVSNYDDDFSYLDFEFIHINLMNNEGIAKAQNLGVKKALELGSEFVLTSDQDTIFPANYVKLMMGKFDKLKIPYGQIAAISPMFKDVGNNQRVHPIVKWSTFGLTKIHMPEEINEVSHVISSGMIIPCSVFSAIGFMDESFFIDWVDTEWCWRANLHGYKIIQFGDVYLSHSLGLQTQKVIFGSFTKHNHIREYFKIRNAFFLLKNPDYAQIPKTLYLLKSILKNIVVSFFRAFKSPVFLRSIYLGVLHGLISKKDNISI